MGVRVTVSEYLTAPPPKQYHALSPVLSQKQAQACVTVSFQQSEVERIAKYKPHYNGALPQWPNLIGRAALTTYMQMLPVAFTTVRQDVRCVGHRAGIVGLALGLSLAWATFEPDQPMFWGLSGVVALAAYHSARVCYYHAYSADACRLEQLLTLSCLAVRGYLGEFGETPPRTVRDARLDAPARNCLRALSNSSDAVSSEALRQYTQWAQHYRYRKPPQELPPPPTHMPSDANSWPEARSAFC